MPPNNDITPAEVQSYHRTLKLIIVLFVMFSLYWEEPDIMDAIIFWLMK